MSRKVMIAFLLMLVPGCPETVLVAPETNQGACERLIAHVAALPCQDIAIGFFAGEGGAREAPDAFNCDVPEGPECDFSSFADCFIPNVTCDILENDPEVALNSLGECFELSGLGSMECIALIDGIEPDDPCMNNTCDDGAACNGVETCDQATGECVDGTSVECADGDICTEPNGDCVVDLCVGNTCDDGAPCNGVETCEQATGACVDGTPIVCRAGFACVAGECIVEPGNNCGRTIQVNPDASVQVYSVTDPVPAGWTVVESTISDGGGFSSSEGEVRWLFFDGQPRTLTYELTSPASASGQTCLEATANYNGDTEVTLPPQCFTAPCGL